MNVLTKRIFRGFKENFIKYIVSFLIFMIGTMMFIAIADSTGSVNLAINNLIKESNCEDGNFLLYSPLSSKDVNELNEHGVTLEKNFYINIKNFNNGTTYRIYKNRNLINLLQIRDGSSPLNNGDIVVEQHYAKTHVLNISNELELDDMNFNICGHGYVIDYDSLYEVGDGPYPDYKNFCLCFVNDETFNKLTKNHTVQYNYSYLLNKKPGNFTDEDLNDYLKSKLINKDKMNHTLDLNDNTCNLINIVGTLSALGYSKKQLTINFIILPVSVVTVSSINIEILSNTLSLFFMQERFHTIK